MRGSVDAIMERERETARAQGEKSCTRHVTVFRVDYLGSRPCINVNRNYDARHGF